MSKGLTKRRKAKKGERQQLFILIMSTNQIFSTVARIEGQRTISKNIRLF